MFLLYSRYLDIFCLEITCFILILHILQAIILYIFSRHSTLFYVHKLEWLKKLNSITEILWLQQAINLVDHIKNENLDAPALVICCNLYINYFL